MSSVDCLQNQYENAPLLRGDNKNMPSGVVDTLARLSVRLVIGVCLAIAVFAICRAQAEPMDDWVKDYVVQIVWGSEQTAAGAGVYLGDGPGRYRSSCRRSSNEGYTDRWSERGS